MGPHVTNAWSLATVELDGAERVAALRADGVATDVPDAAQGAGLMAVMDRWEQVAAALRDFDPAGAPELSGASLVAPLRYPRKLICAGANYGPHLEEMNVPVPREPPDPFFFLLPPTTTLIGPGVPVRIPSDSGWKVDWEAELAVVIGRGGRRIAAADAHRHVAGYSAFNDISARGRHRRPDPLAPPFEFDWLASKGVDGFCPMGPGMVPTWLVDDPHRLRIRCWRNGELEQDGNTAGMLNEVWRLIEAISASITLEPGDVIATGTPAGVGVAHGKQLAPGDSMVVDIEGVGRLETPVVADGS